MKLFITVSDVGFHLSLVIASTSAGYSYRHYTAKLHGRAVFTRAAQETTLSTHCPQSQNCDQLSLDIPECVGLAQWVQRLEYWMEDRGN